MIKLTVQRYKKNEHYKQELKESEERNKYNSMHAFDGERPQLKVIDGLLDVFITEEQFEAIRKEVLKTF